MSIAYKRILLKLSGEVLAGPAGKGIDNETVLSICKSVKKIADLGVEVAIVVGGGNFWRGRTSEHMDRTRADHIGMLATAMNSLALCDALEAATGVPTVVMDANDFDQNQLGKGTKFPLTDEQIQDAMADNPSGQGDELTPFILIRPLD